MDTIKFSFKQCIPILPSYLFMGLAAGVLFSTAGYSPIWSFISSALIYAGSMQVVMVSLIVSGASFTTVAMMSLFVNARHIFYGIAMLKRFKKKGLRGAYMAMFLTDATYSILDSLRCPDNVDRDGADFYISLFSHLIWIFSCTAGALFGQLIPFDMKGVEFSSAAFFMVFVVKQWKETNLHMPAIMGLLSGIVFWIIFGAENFILPSICVCAIVLGFMKDRIETQEKGVDNCE